MRPLRALALGTSVSAAALLGCAQLQALRDATNTNKPLADGSPAPARTPGELAARLRDAGNQISASVDAISRSSSEAIDAISADDERAVGQAAAINIIQQSGGLVLEEGLVRYVNAVANHVASKGERTEKGKDGVPRLKARRFFVGVLDDDSMNAYALPGGYILVTRGLLQNLSCESDLAWVLGHEIAHVDREHGLKALKLAVGTKAFAESLRGGRSAEEVASFRSQAFFEKVADRLTEISFRVGLGRQDERDADDWGFQYATAAGYDAQGPKRVLDLLATNPTRRKIFKTHDEPATRLQRLSAKIAPAPNDGRLGLDRFDEGAIRRLEAARRASAHASP